MSVPRNEDTTQIPAPRVPTALERYIAAYVERWGEIPRPSALERLGHLSWDDERGDYQDTDEDRAAIAQIVRTSIAALEDVA